MYMSDKEEEVKRSEELSFDDDGLSERDSQAIETEYIQAGEEARYRHNLMHNSYYLIIILNILAMGPVFGFMTEGKYLPSAIGAFIVGISILFLSTTIYANHSKRGAAWSRRSFIERKVTNHEFYRLQRDTTVRRAQFVPGNDGLKYRPRKKNWLESLHSKDVPYIFGLNAIAWFVLSALSTGFLIS